MIAITMVLSLVTAAIWTWVIGDHNDWWQRAAAHRRHKRAIH